MSKLTSEVNVYKFLMLTSVLINFFYFDTINDKITFFQFFSVNKISTLAPFEECVNLQELYLRKNNIQDLNDLAYLQVRYRFNLVILSAFSILKLQQHV